MAKLKVVCAWCGEPMGEKEGNGVKGISHSICDDCLLHNFPDVYEKLQRKTLTEMLIDEIKITPGVVTSVEEIFGLNSVKEVIKMWLREVGLPLYGTPESIRKLLITLVDEP